MGRGNLEKVKNRISICFKALLEKAGNWLTKSERVGKWVKKSGKCREFHVFKGVANTQFVKTKGRIFDQTESNF